MAQKVSIRKVYEWDWDQSNTFQILIIIVHMLSFPVTNTLPKPDLTIFYTTKDIHIPTAKRKSQDYIQI